MMVQGAWEMFEKDAYLSRRVDSREVVRLYNSGFSTWQIAEDLGVSQTAVRYHLKKQGATTRSIGASKRLAHQKESERRVKERAAGVALLEAAKVLTTDETIIHAASRSTASAVRFKGLMDAIEEAEKSLPNHQI